VLVIVLADALRYCAALFPDLIFQGSQETMDDIFRFLFKFASDSELVTNYYTRAYLVKAIYGFTPHRQSNASAPLPSPLLGVSHGRDPVYMYTHVCMYVYTYVCMYVCMYVWLYVCMYVCMYVCIIPMYVCIICICTHTHKHTHTHRS
jgi:hypothetical protein